MSIEARTLEAYELLHEGIKTLSDIEEYGMRIDVEYCKKQYERLSHRIRLKEDKLDTFKEVRRWKKIYGKKFKINSDQQLSNLLYKKLGVKPVEFTANGNPSVEQTSLEKIKTPFIPHLLQLKKYLKCRDTYISNYIKESVDSVLHSFFHLHIARTFRSSSSRINFQNQPVRDPEIAKIVRTGVIPRPGFMIAEADYSGIEVTASAFYHKDPKMIDDICDPNKDMHRDMSMECYLLPISELNDGSKRAKDIRYCGKNKFVFPQFYGDYYKPCARNLWEAAVDLDLHLKSEERVQDHLKKKGYHNLDKYEKHIKKVEYNFWNRRYKVYGKWKEAQWKKYCNDGYVDLLTGFRCGGFMSRNDAINYPIQGVAFHCLLWSLIIFNLWLKTNNMKTKIIGQIHDSIVMEIWPPELEEVIQALKRIMTVEIREHWKWIIIPLEIEIEVAPVDKSWFYKKEIHEEKPCECGNKWLYRKYLDDGFKVLECPICGRKVNNATAS